MIKLYLKIAVRNLLKYKIQNIISIVCMAVGILSFTLCFYVSRYFLDVDKCFENRDRIAILSYYAANGYNSIYTSADVGNFIRDWNLKEVEECCYVVDLCDRDFMIYDEKGNPLPYKLNSLEADTLFNRVFTPDIIAGSWKTVSNTMNSVILTASCAERLFGDVYKAVGKQLISTSRLRYSHSSIPRSGGDSYTVGAVMADLPANNSLTMMHPCDMVTFNDNEGYFASDRRKYVDIGYNYALLSHSTTIEDLNQRLERYKMTGDLEAFGLKGILMRENSKDQGKTFVLITGALGILLLLVGFINFFHFLIGSFINRMKEFSIMKLYGNDKRRLFMLLFTESMFKILGAFFIVLWMIEVLLNDFTLSFGTLINVSFSERLLYIQSLEYIALATLLCAVVCGLVARRISHISVQKGILGGNGRLGKQFGRNIMLAIQFFVCWIFFIGTASLFMLSQNTNAQLISSLSRKEKSEILSVPLDYSFLSHADKVLIINRIGQHSGVKDILWADCPYLDGSSGIGFYTNPEKGRDSFTKLDSYAVPHNFFSFMNIKIEQGREPQAEGDILVDRYWQTMQGKDVIGMSLYSDNTYTICGVCAPFYTHPYRQRLGRGSAFFFDDENVKEYVEHCYVKCHDGQMDDVKVWIENIKKEMLPANVSPRIKTIADDIRDNQPMVYTLMKVILLFSIVSITLTLLGVYSSITLDTERRRKEMAIRKINGAGIKQIMFIFCKLYFILLGVTALIVFPICYIILNQISPSYLIFFDYGPLFWVGVFVIVFALTFLTIIFRILRTAKENPAEVLKRE